jgi:class 3 adenylate cyclase
MVRRHASAYGIPTTRKSHVSATCAAFIACAGAPDVVEVSEAVSRVSACAARMLAIVEAFRTPTTHRAITIRVGVHVGRVLGAVLGSTLVCAAAAELHGTLARCVLVWRELFAC